MIDYTLAICYGVVVPANKIDEIRKVLTDEAYDEMLDNYTRCINSWSGENYFIGIMSDIAEGNVNLVYHVSNFSIPSDDDEDLINFKQFFNKHNLWKIIDWNPELLLINFCF